MQCDGSGFFYPKINEKECVKCGICVKICPFENDNKHKNYNQLVYASWSKDSEVIKQSSSGGIFTQVAQYVIYQEGLVFGATMHSSFDVKHICINNKEDLKKLRGSKYVQSDTNNTFLEVKDELKKGIKVLYVGTPCQISGLKSFLRYDYDNLITMDVLCHGVPSNKIFKKYIEYLQNKHKSKILDFNFRDKKQYGWGHNFSYKIKGKRLYFPAVMSPYLNAFLKNKILRDSCYECKYKDINRTGDISLGDFWNISILHPEIEQREGISLVIVNSLKGQQIIDNIDSIIKIESNIEKALKSNQSLCEYMNISNDRSEHINISSDRNNIYKNIDTTPFKKLAKKYMFDDKYSYYKIYYYVTSKIPKSIKTKIKNLIN
jgi:coenzyme F420-reducing hydrogenase beta subunit